MPGASSPDDPKYRLEFNELSKLIVKHNTLIADGKAKLSYWQPQFSPFSDTILEDTGRGHLQLRDFESFITVIRLYQSEVSSPIFLNIKKKFSKHPFSELHVIYVPLASS